jgi:hypothetical protein
LLSRAPHTRAPLLSSLIIQIAAVFMHVENPADMSRLSRIASYYLMATTFYAVIWTARISILFSIIRIDPDLVMRRRLRWLAAAFVGALVFYLVQLLWTCERKHDGWKNMRSPQCHIPKVVAICQLVCTPYSASSLQDSLLTYLPKTADILSDLALILLPIRLIRGIKEKRLRWRLVFIFSTASMLPSLYILPAKVC